MTAFWVILTGALVAGACGFLGCFLVLRRLSLVGDAISHAVLPGIVVAFLWSGSRAPLPMFVGAVVLGLLATFLIQSLSRGGVQGDAAIGVTFTALFAVGVVLISRFADKVDLDLDCVLHGDIAYSGLDLWLVGGTSLGPRPVWIMGGLLLLNLAVVGLFYKELKLCAFDPDMAAAVGINVALMHYLLMGLVSVTTVGAFESVGAILVVAMLIVPGATAYLLTDRLERMLLLAVGVGVLSAGIGYGIARALDASIAGSMAGAGGGLFTLAFLFSPSHGLVTRLAAQRRLRRQVAEEDALLWAVRRLERDDGGFSLRDLGQGLEWLPADAAAAASTLVRRGLFSRAGERLALTEEGLQRAVELLRRHRLYESFLDELGYPADHLHGAADRAEHHLSAALTAAVADATRYPERDPQGKPIPRRPGAGE